VGDIGFEMDMANDRPDLEVLMVGAGTDFHFSRIFSVFPPALHPPPGGGLLKRGLFSGRLFFGGMCAVDAGVFVCWTIGHQLPRALAMQVSILSDILQGISRAYRGTVQLCSNIGLQWIVIFQYSLVRFYRKNKNTVKTIYYKYFLSGTLFAL